MERSSKALLLILALGLIIRLFVFVNYSAGSLYPDEMGQILEPAHQLAFGYSLKAWEWEQGIRSWFLPGLYAGILAGGKLLGITDSTNPIFLIYFFNLLLSLITIYAAFLMARDLGGQTAAIIAGLLTAFSFFIVKHSLRPFSEPVGLNFLLLSLALIYKGSKNGKTVLIVLAGIFLGISFIIRFPYGLFFIPAIVFILLKQRRLFPPFIASLSFMLILGGVLDYFTWGGFFQAPIEFLRFNVLENKSVQFGIEPPGWYLTFLLHDKSWAVLALLFFAAGALKGGFIFSCIALYLVVFSFIPHKEVRFILPVIPLCLVLMSVGIEGLTGWLARWKRLRTAVIGCLILLFITYPTFKFSNEMKPDNHDAFMALNFVGRQDDATGLLYIGYWYNSGGYSYLHRDIPLLFCSPDIYAPKTLDEALYQADIVPAYGPYLLSVASYSKVNLPTLNYAFSEDPRYKDILLKHGFTEFSKFGKAVVYKR